MASPAHARSSFPALVSILAVMAAYPVDAQTMVEYGHMAAGAAKGASSLRKASPAQSFRRLGDTLAGDRTSATQGGVRTSGVATGIGTTRDRSEAPSAITVLRVDWGAPDSAETAPEQPDPQTMAKKDVFEIFGSAPTASEVPDIEEKGLSTGMNVAQVSKILGDPAIQAAGLAGRGYDEKRLYRLSESWQVMVFSARGSVTAFVPTPAPKKSANRVLSDGDSVIP